jgi:hypothetical protein
MYIPEEILIVIFILFFFAWTALVRTDMQAKEWEEKYQEMRDRYYTLYVKVNGEDSEGKAS